MGSEMCIRDRFKSAAAKAIIEEVGKTPRPTIYANKRAERKDKKRSFTITGSQPAVMEALNEHQAKMVISIISYITYVIQDSKKS